VRGGRSFAVGLAVAALCLAGAARILHARDASFPDPPLADRLLYLRSGGVADRLMLSFDAVAADIYWIRTIQYFGRDLRSGRPDQFALLQPLLDLTTTLDPHFNIAYRFGAIFLALERPNGAGRLDQAIGLLEKGLRADPQRWQYAHDIGFLHYWFGQDYRRAAEWFERASAMPHAPAWVGPLAAITRAQGGDRRGARQLLESLAASPEAYVRAAAERGLLQLQALDAVDELRGLVDAFEVRTGGLPGGWADVLPGVPVDPAGVPFLYDPATGQVALSPRSPLGPLPRVPAAR
jgi:tetratricopeptide (TPR) repeat protein